jgi:alpha-ketoglutarate-dependent taurine dioxygenase
MLFRGFGFASEDQFAALAAALCPELMDYVGGNSPRTRVEGKIYTATEYPSSAKITLHNEASYTNEMPRIIMFFCATPPSAGGQTPIADSRRVLTKLDPTITEQFARKRVKYLNNLHAGHGIGRSWQDTFQTLEKSVAEKWLVERGYEFEWKADGSLRTSLVCDPIKHHPRTGEASWVCQADQWHSSNLDPSTRRALLSVVSERDLPHHACYGDDSPLAETDLKHIRQTFDAEAAVFEWSKHDVLICDNILTAHGRQPFTGSRRILVAMA